MECVNDDAIATSLSTLWEPIPSATQLPQIKHRLALLRRFALFGDQGLPDSTAAATQSSLSSDTGPKILEIGCGQGDTTACLLALLDHTVGAGKGAHVTALDPGPPDYGSPLSLSQAQKLVSARFGAERVTFVQDDAVSFINSFGPGDGEKPFYAVVLVKSVWYFPSQHAVVETLRAAAKVADRVFIAEYALDASRAEGEAHVLTAKACAQLYAAATATTTAPTSISDGVEVRKLMDNFLEGCNLRIAPTPTELKELAAHAGLKAARESTLEPDAELQDGRWEVGSCLAESGRAFFGRVAVVEKASGESLDAVRAAFDRARDVAMSLAVGQEGGEGKGEQQKMKQGLKRVKTMDVWCAEFVVGVSVDHQEQR